MNIITNWHCLLNRVFVLPLQLEKTFDKEFDYDHQAGNSFIWSRHVSLL
ncbi:MAG: hypothetical protein VYE30_07015 [Pseudomonadota bacterium]|nr:hypothetical protein [Pseudomonadota bacterium]